MIRNGEASLDEAAARLTRAIDALEARLAAMGAAGAAPAVDTGKTDALHARLREVRLRERALEGAAAEASTVLGRAAEQIRAALSETDEDADEAPGDPDTAGEGAAVLAASLLGPSLLDDLSEDQTDLHPTARREF